jgi:hypothetical protein
MYRTIFTTHVAVSGDSGCGYILFRRFPALLALAGVFATESEL